MKKIILILLVLIISSVLYPQGFDKKTDGHLGYYSSSNLLLFEYSNYYFQGRRSGSGGWISNWISSSTFPTIGPSMYDKGMGLGWGGEDHLSFDINWIEEMYLTELGLYITDDLTVTAGNFIYAGIAITSTGAELNLLDGATWTTAESNILDADESESVYDSGGGIIVRTDGASQVIFDDGILKPNTDNDIDLGAALQQYKDLYIDGIAYLDAIDLNGTAITSTGAELNILDGVTATAAELNLLDGATWTTAESNILDAGESESIYDSGTTIIFQTDAAAQIVLDDGQLLPNADNDIDLGTALKEYKDGYFDGTLYTDILAVHETSSFTGDATFSGDILMSDNGVIGITGNEIITFNAAGTINFSGAEAHFENNAAAATFGLVTTNADVVLAFDAVTAQGSITYMEDEDRFDFDNDIKVIGDIEAGDDITATFLDIYEVAANAEINIESDDGDAILTLDGGGIGNHNTIYFMDDGVSYWRIYHLHSSNDELHIYDDINNSYVMTWGQNANNGLVGIGDNSPDAHVDIEDLTIETTENYYGVQITHIKTAGVTDHNDVFYGYDNYIGLNQAAGEIGYLSAFQNEVQFTDGAVGDAVNNRDVFAFENIADINGLAGSGDIFGDLYGMSNIIDIENTMNSITGDVYGIYSFIDDDEGVGGTVYGLYLDEADGVDFGLYQNGTADNYFGGKITTLDDCTAERYMSELATIVASADNVDVGSCSILNCDTAIGNVTIGGFINGTANQILYIYNSDTNNIIIEDDEGTGNQDIKTNTGVDVTITAEGGATLIYDGTDGFWRLIGAAL